MRPFLFENDCHYADSKDRDQDKNFFFSGNFKAAHKQSAQTPDSGINA